MSYIRPDDALTLSAILLAMAWIGFMADASRWGKAIPGVVCILVLGIALSNLHITPFTSPVSDFVSENIVAAAIPLLMIKADLISATELRRFSLITFGYAAVCLVEGTGLMLEKRWAEYFTVTLTSLALPLECYELYKQFTPLRIALLLVNIFVVAYLVWLLRREPTESAP